MTPISGTLHLSASDLSTHLGCRHATQLDRARAEGRLEAAEWRDPNLAVLAERGMRHEQAYLAHLRAQGLTVCELPVEGLSRAEALSQALAAMRRGEEIIAQAALGAGRWFGRADVLRRVDAPSRLGAWSYVPEDTKLAQETRAGAVLQLCLYADLLAQAQGVLPATVAVVAPGKDFVADELPVSDFLAYYRLVKSRLEAEVDLPLGKGGALPTEGEPVEHCEICRWRSLCEDEWRAKDHLSLVANVSRLTRGELAGHSVTTLAALAKVPSPPWPWKPDRGARKTLQKAREQARVQLEGRRRGAPYHELLARESVRGLSLLPAPDAGDLFFDFEGDVFVDGGGLEYLFGWVALEADGTPRYEKLWALTRVREREAFERFMDLIVERWKRFPQMHVYHFASYEPAHLRILAGRHAIRLDEIESMLRGGLFVDLLTVTRQALRASVESYSIKRLEAFYGFRRELDLEAAGAARRLVERTLELEPGSDIAADVLDRVALYNRDDCVSTLKLRGWLEKLRTEVVRTGEVIERPAPKDPEPKEEVAVRQRETAALQGQLLEGVPADPATRSSEERGRWLLAQLLDFHRREDSCSGHEYHRLRALDEDGAIDERDALGGLVHVERSRRGKKTIDRYRFPPQDCDLTAGDALLASAGPESTESIAVGEVVEIDCVEGSIDVSRAAKRADFHPKIAFVHLWIDPKELRGALHRLAASIVEAGFGDAQRQRAAIDLLLRAPPRLASGAKLTALDADAGQVALALDHGVLPIQGPPGTGKTYTGAQLILDLVAGGKRVGVTANGHEVIDNLLEAVQAGAGKRGIAVRCGHKDKTDHPRPGIAYTNDNPKVLGWLQDRAVEVLGGTPYLWARQEFHGAVDVLVVDEAGQLSLANALAASQAADSLVLIGDPCQLDQPMQGAHPDGCAVSALEHLLGGAPTVPVGHGLFLAETRRLHPEICAFTSELFYGGKLGPREGLERQRVNGSKLGPEPLAGSGLRLLLVEHAGCSSESGEEVETVARLVQELLAGGRTWTKSDGTEASLGPDDVLIVAPYNAQVDALRRRLNRPGLRVGTVDKFQGQEAPVVIVSLTSSSAQDAPRGMEFLYSPNRLNVATSRAQCACFLVASPLLFEPECRTPAQMRLANAFCRYRELATIVR